MESEKDIINGYIAFVYKESQKTLSGPFIKDYISTNVSITKSTPQKLKEVGFALYYSTIISQETNRPQHTILNKIEKYEDMIELLKKLKELKEKYIIPSNDIKIPTTNKAMEYMKTHQFSTKILEPKTKIITIQKPKKENCLRRRQFDSKVTKNIKTKK